MWSSVIKLFKLINSEQEPHQISLGLSLAMVAGFTPFISLHNLVVLFFLLVLRANISAFLVGLALFSLLAYALDPLFHGLGNSLLHLPALQAMWTEMYNSTFWRLTHFNNTVLLGSLVVSVVALVPTFLLANTLIRLYRSRLQQRYGAATARLTQVLKLGNLFGRFGGNG